MRITELLLHPIRIRIVQSAMDGTAITTSELCARMPDVSKATMYRHVALLVEGGLLKVVGEERVRGAVERSYRLEHTRAILADAEVAAMSTDDHRRGFAVRLSSAIATARSTTCWTRSRCRTTSSPRSCDRMTARCSCPALVTGSWPIGPGSARRS